MDEHQEGRRWLERVTTQEFWMIAGPILLCLGVFVLVLID